MNDWLPNPLLRALLDIATATAYVQFGTSVTLAGTAILGSVAVAKRG